MNTEPLIRAEPQPKLVDWQPLTRRAHALAPELVQAAAVAGVVFAVTSAAVGAYFLARQARKQLRKLEVDRLVVRNLTVLQNAARMQ